MILQTQKPSNTTGVPYDRQTIETNNCPVRVLLSDGTVFEISEASRGFIEIRGITGGSDQLVIRPYSPNVLLIRVTNFWSAADE